MQTIPYPELVRQLTSTAEANGRAQAQREADAQARAQYARGFDDAKRAGDGTALFALVVGVGLGVILALFTVGVAP